MYGYIRPDKGELKVKEYETFQGVYCGLCHTLKKRYGPLYRFMVNYDMTFLAMLLTEGPPPEMCPRRCPYRLRGKNRCAPGSPAMDAAADYTVILARWKARDGVKDRGFFGALESRAMLAFMKRAYGRAAARRPGFAGAAEENLKALDKLEAEKCPSVDAAADRFARILQAAGAGAETPERARILEELLYHLGRIVYILDAADDLEEDEKTGAYNPLRYRYGTENGRLAPADRDALLLTLEQSHNRLSAAYVLLENGPYESIVSNIIYRGLPAVTQAVFAGTWKASKRKKDSTADSKA